MYQYMIYSKIYPISQKAEAHKWSSEISFLIYLIPSERIVKGEYLKNRIL